MISEIVLTCFCQQLKIIRSYQDVKRSREIYIELHTVILLLLTIKFCHNFAILCKKNWHGIDEKYHK